ncbi:MAG: aryldialkylphosphatase [Chloroflexi bacterium]|nr:aryldialkylphosphatase [Chloroflexota bacterium]
MRISNLAGRAVTVLGPVDAGRLGVTVTHEHFLIDFRIVFIPPTRSEDQRFTHEKISLQNLGWIRFNWASNFENLHYEDEGLAIREARAYANAGGNAVVDATSVGLKRNPAALVNISTATGLNIIMGSGYYIQASHPPEFARRGVDDIAAEIVRDITTGVGDSGIRSGIIGEIGCSWPWTADERKSVEAAVAAQQETGAPLLIHPGRNERAPMQILEFVLKHGGNVKRTIMGHIERTVFAPSILSELASTGVFLEYDLFGHDSPYYPFAPKTYMPSDAQRIEQIERLIGAGHIDQILLAHDICSRHRLKEYGGHGFDHIPARVVPWMLERGMAHGQIDAMLKANPARIMAFV